MDVKREKRCQRFALKLLSKICVENENFVNKLYPIVTIYERENQWAALVRIWPLDAGPFLIDVYNCGVATIRSFRKSVFFLNNVRIDYSYRGKPTITFID